jgi:choline kinase
VYAPGGERPLLSRIMGNLLRVGIEKILVVTGYGAKSVENLANVETGICKEF